MSFADLQEFFFLFYSDTLFVIAVCFLVASMFLAVTSVVKVIDET